MSSRGRPLSVIVVVGTRPDAIKLAPVAAALGRAPEEISCRVVATAQHRELLDQVLDEFGIVVDVDLDLMRDDQQPARVLADAVAGLDAVIAAHRPDLVLVQGDTTTALAGALASFYRRVPVAHVEAGLRTCDRDEPFPEEAHRRLIGRIADLHFAPTPGARAALEAEGVDPETIFVTGNTVIDALRTISARRVRRTSGHLLLVTLHRRENWGAPLARVCAAVRRLLDRDPSLHVVVSVHPNPRVRPTIEAALGDCPRVRLIAPPAYGDFVGLLASATLVLTDSGGIQEEAPSLGVPVLVARAETERPEGVRADVARLVGVDEEAIVREAEAVLGNGTGPFRHPGARDLYGDGRAAERIVGVLRAWAGHPVELPDEFAPPQLEPELSTAVRGMS